MARIDRLSRNTLILLANNVITAVLAFVVTILISRGLGDAAFGHYATVMAWVLPLSIGADFGVATLVTRNVASRPSAAHAYLRRALRVRWLVGGGIVVGVLVLAPWLSQSPTVVMGLRIAILLSLVDALFGTYTAIFRAWEVMWPILLLNTLFFGLQIAGIGIILWQEGDILLVLAAIVSADIIQLLGTWGLWRLHLRHRYSEATAVIDVQHVVRKAWPFAVAGVLAILQVRAIVILLDRYLPAEAVGWYAAAARLVEAARLAPSALFVALFPQLAALASEPARFVRLFRWSAWGLSLYAAGFALVCLLAGRPVVYLLFGAQFEDAISVLVLLSWSLLPGVLRALMTLRLYAMRRESRVNWMLASAVLVQLGAGAILIPVYGPEGAAAAVIASEILLLIGLWASARRLMPRFVQNASSC
ncbi:MAG: oligosaccharide flippase family protein [Chloroflexi bacterium]|nr:oligosaccharide flippase family protein [Chloroflexota bacterium]